VVAALPAVGGLVLAVLAWLAGTTASAQAAGNAGGGTPPGAVYASLTPVVVQPGQSLWSIALRVQPAADPRRVIAEIIDLNGLRGTGLQPGERLWVPRG
jgi:LysM repeat protein